MEIESEQNYNVPNEKKFIGNCEVIKKLGEGSYGKVYLAKNLIDNELSAIKVFKYKSSENGIHSDILREIGLLQVFKNCENIVQLKNYYSSLDEIQMELEYCDSDLTKFIYSNRNNPEKYNLDHIKRIMSQLLKGIMMLHIKKIMHRDLKPSNLLLKDGIVKIGDFGLSRMYTIPDKVYSREVATFWYRAPEIFLGLPYSNYIDVWSIGCIFGELLCQEPLFHAKDEIGLVSQLVQTFGNFTADENLMPGSSFSPIDPSLKKTFSNIRPIGLAELIRQKAKFYISDETFDLLNKMLQVNPNKRISCKEALEHPYFSD